MTTITADQLTQTRSTRSFRHTVGGFLAGAVLASAGFIGVNVLSDSGSASPAAPVVQHVTPPSPSGCPVVRGAC